MVGRWRLSREVSQTEVALGEPVQVKLVLEGRGNLQGVQLPALGAPAAFKAFDADRNRKMIALDAGQIHHSMLSGMRDLPKTREVVKARVVSGWAEIMTPVKQVGLRLDTHEIPTRLIDAVREWRQAHAPHAPHAPTPP